MEGKQLADKGRYVFPLPCLVQNNTLDSGEML